MNLKKVKLVHETPSHFIMHDGKTHFHIAKTGLNKEMVEKIQGFAEGGEAHDKKNMKQLKKSMNKFLDEETSEYAQGGEAKLGTGKRFAKLENKLSQNPDIKDPAAVAAAIGRKKYGAKKFNKLAHHMNEGGDTVEENDPDKDIKEMQDQAESYESTLKQLKESDMIKGYAKGGYPEGTSQVVMDLFTPEEVAARAQMRQQYQQTAPAPIQPAPVKPLDQSAADFYQTMQKRAHGGEIDHGARMVPSIDHMLIPMSEEEKALAAAQHFAYATPTNQPADSTNLTDQSQLPPQLTQNISEAQQQDAVNAGVPGAVNPIPGMPQTPPTSGADLAQFKQQAETEGAQKYLEQQAAAQQIAAQTAAEQESMRQKTIADNQVRTAAGLPPIPVSDMPATPAPVPADLGMVDQNNQISLKPQQGASPYGQLPDVVSEFQRGSELQQAGIIGSSQAQAEAARTDENLMRNYVKSEQDRQALYNQEMQTIQNDNEDLKQKILTKQIDPNHYWNNLSTGNKISAALAMILGGAGAGLTGQPNVAVNFIQKAIQDDIESQKADQSNLTTMYRLGLDKYRDRQLAEQFATIQAHNVLSAQIQQTAARLGTQDALFKADQALGLLAKQDGPIMNNLAIQSSALRMLNQPQRSGGVANSPIDNNRWTALKQVGLISPGDEGAIEKEAQQLVEADNLRKSLHDSFNKLSDAALAGHLTPGLRDTEMQSLAGKLAKFSEGRFNLQESKQQIEAVMPAGLDILSPKVRNERLLKLDQLTEPATPMLDKLGLRIRRPTFTPGAPKGK